MYIVLLDLGMTMRGSQKQLLYLARALKEHPSLTVQVACPAQSALAECAAKQGLDVVRLSGTGTRSLRSAFKLTRLARRCGRIILHTHGPLSARLGAFCKKFCKKHIVLLHTRADCVPIERAMRSAYIKADGLVGVSAETARVILDTGISPNKVSVIHSAIDPAQYPARHERGDGRFVFGVVGELAPEKGYAVLIDALAFFQDKYKNTAWEIRIVGQGPMFGDIIEHARSAGVDSHLALLGDQDTRKILPECDAVIVPSVQAEGSSAAIKEAWAIGLPVIASDLPSNIELVHDEENGLLYLHSKPEALAASMLRIVSDAGLSKRMVEGGQKSLTRFAHTRIAESYIALYTDLLRQQPASA